MPLARHEDDVARTREHHGRADRLGAVGDAQVARSGFQPRSHVVENRFGRLVARVVGGENRGRGIFHGYCSHLGTLGPVAVAAAAAHHDQLLAGGADLFDGLDHVLQRIGRMGVIDDGRRAVCRLYLLETAAHGVQHAQHTQHLAPVQSQQHRGTVDRQQVVGVEPPQQPHPQLLPVDAQQHAVEVHLDDLAAEIGHRAQRIGAHRRRGVLHHHAPVPVISVRQRESALGQPVEKELLGPDVLGEGLVVVEVVVCDVREDAARKIESPCAFLHDSVRRALHEAVFAPGVGHLTH